MIGASFSHVLTKQQYNLVLLKGWVLMLCGWKGKTVGLVESNGSLPPGLTMLPAVLLPRNLDKLWPSALKPEY